MGFFDKLKSLFSKKVEPISGPAHQSNHYNPSLKLEKQGESIVGSASVKNVPKSANPQQNALAEKDYQYEPAADGGVIITKFLGDWSAREVRIPDTLGGRPVTEIGRLAFVDNYTGDLNEELHPMNCDTFVEHEVLYLPDTIHTIGDCAFAESKFVHTLHLPSQLRTIGIGAFHDNSYIESIDFPASLESIGSDAFSISKLKTIHFGEKIHTIGESAFSVNLYLSEVHFPKSLREIGIAAFGFCENLEKVSFQEGLLRVGARAFHTCTSLTEVHLPDSLMDLGTSCFDSCTSLCSISMPANVPLKGNPFPNCLSLQKIDFRGISPNTLRHVDGVVFNAKDELIAYPPYVVDESYTLPTNTTAIAEKAFAGNTHLKSVSCRMAMRMIGSFAFENCDELEEIVLGKNIRSIGYQAFKGCRQLTLYAVPGSDTETAILKYNKNYEAVKTAATATRPKRKWKKGPPISTTPEPEPAESSADTDQSLSDLLAEFHSAVQGLNTLVKEAQQETGKENAVVDFAFSMNIPDRFEYSLTPPVHRIGIFEYEHVLVAVQQGYSIHAFYNAPEFITVMPEIRAGRNTFTDIRSKEGKEYIESNLNNLTNGGALPYVTFVDEPTLEIILVEEPYSDKTIFSAGIFCNKGIYTIKFVIATGSREGNMQQAREMLLSIQPVEKPSPSVNKKSQRAKPTASEKDRILVDKSWSVAIPEGFKASVDPKVIDNSTGSRVLAMVPRDMDLGNVFGGDESVSATRLPISLDSGDSLHSNEGRATVKFVSELISAPVENPWEVLIKRENLIVGYCEGPDFGPPRFYAGVFTNQGMYQVQLFIPDASRFARDDRAREVLMSIRSIDDPEETKEPPAPAVPKKTENPAKTTKTSKASSALKAIPSSPGETLVSLHRKIPEAKPQYSEESYDFTVKRMTHNWMMNAMLGAIQKSGFISVKDDLAVYELGSLNHERITELFDELEKLDFPAAEDAIKFIEVLHDSTLADDEQSSFYNLPKKRMIARFEMLEALQSFAWCTHSYATDSNQKPDSLPTDTLLAICKLIESREYVNYTEDSYCPQLSKIMAYGNFFTQFSTNSPRNMRVMHVFGLKKEKHGSLLELRKELASLLEPIRKLHQHLLEQKQQGESLDTVPTLILSAWSAFALAVHEDFQLQKPEYKEEPKKPTEYTEEIELVGTGYDGRTAANESLNIGETVTLERNPYNLHDSNAIEVFDSIGQSIGHIPRNTAGYWAQAMDDGRLRILSAEVIKTVPLSQRSARAKNPVTVIEVKYERD